MLEHILYLQQLSRKKLLKPLPFYIRRRINIGWFQRTKKTNRPTSTAKMILALSKLTNAAVPVKLAIGGEVPVTVGGAVLDLVLVVLNPRQAPEYFGYRPPTGSHNLKARKVSTAFCRWLAFLFLVAFTQNTKGVRAGTVSLDSATYVGKKTYSRILLWNKYLFHTQLTFFRRSDSGTRIQYYLSIRPEFANCNVAVRRVNKGVSFGVHAEHIMPKMREDQIFSAYRASRIVSQHQWALCRKRCSCRICGRDNSR